jgi:2-amino-4-hydroxy-6-hydroxymethyldihydropteridine diphosphokinase
VLYILKNQNYSIETGNKTLCYLSACMKKNEVFISLGSNLGDRAENLKTAIHAIELKVGAIVRQSSVYETKPWGKSNQPDFFNQVILVHSDLSPQDCLLLLSAVEEQMGRKREEKWGARIIDLDLLYVGDEVIHTEKLSLPHPGISQRRFVLVPLIEIAPDFVHPQLRKDHRQLLSECSDLLEVKLKA